MSSETGGRSGALPSVGFLGGGMMCEAILRGVLAQGLVRAESVWVSDVAEPRLQVMRSIGVHATKEGRDVVKHTELIILAVKPDVVPAALNDVADLLGSQHLLVSICAGVPLSQLESSLPAGAPAVRVMPNTPCLVGAAAAAYALGSNATAELHGALVERMFGAVGVAVCVAEKHLEAVTGVSGSGPAYVFMFIESLTDGGVRAGLPRDVARKLAAQTVYGSAKMAIEQSDVHVAELRNRVESPGGTTIAASHALEDGDFRATVMNAVLAAATRGAELGKGLPPY